MIFLTGLNVATAQWEDLFEDNDSIANATDATTTWGVWLSDMYYAGFKSYASQTDPDVYKIRVLPGFTRILAECRFQHVAGDIELQLHDGLVVLASSVGTTNDERIDYTVPFAGDYYLKVYGAVGTGDQGNLYDLWWDVTTPGGDDKYEPNNDWTTPYDSSMNEGKWLSQLKDMPIHRDVDWYKISLASQLFFFDRLMIECRFRHATDDIDIGLYDGTGSLVAQSLSSTDNELIDYTLPDGGDYYICVYQPAGAPGAPYDLKWKLLKSGDDAYEPNDSIIEPWTPGPGQSWEDRLLSSIAGPAGLADPDFYMIDVPSRKTRVLVALLFSRADGNLDLWFDQPGNRASWSWPTGGDNTYGEFRVSNLGKYYLEVVSYDPIFGPIPYDLKWITTQDFFPYMFASDQEGWEWFSISGPGFAAPGHSHDPGGSLAMTETPTDQIVFGSWESPKDPMTAVHPSAGSVLRGRFTLRSTVDGASCPGFRFRVIATPVIESGGQWTPDFQSRDLHDVQEVQYHTIDAFHVGGREPGQAGKTYDVLFSPQFVPTVFDPDVVVYFTCDLLDIATWETDAGSLYIDQVEFDNFPSGTMTGTSIQELTFADFSSGWTVGTKALPGGAFNDTGLSVKHDASGVHINVAEGNAFFEAFAESDPVALSPGNYCRARFFLSAAGIGAGDIAPTIRAGFSSSKFVFAATKELKGGGSRAFLDSTPRAFDVWMRVPTADPAAGGVTEPIGLRLQSYLTTNPNGWPFNDTISGTITCSWVGTEVFPVP